MKAFHSSKGERLGAAGVLAGIIVLVCFGAVRESPPEPALPPPLAAVHAGIPLARVPTSPPAPILRAAPAVRVALPLDSATAARSVVARSTAVTGPLADALRSTLNWSAPAVPPAPVPVVPPRRIVPGLLPKMAAPTRAQTTALTRLRWAAGRDLRYALNEAGSVSLLAGGRLHPAANAPEPGATLAETTARQFLRAQRTALRLKDSDAEITRVSERRDSRGYTHVRFEQSYEGLEVYPAEFVVQTDPAGDVSLFMSTAVPTPESVNITPTLDAEAALRVARTHLGAGETAPVPERALVVFAPVDQTPDLAWRFRIHASAFADWTITVSAHSGKVVRSFNRVCSAAATGSGQDETGATRPLNLWQHTDSRFYLCDTSKPMFVTPGSTPPFAARVKGAIVINDLAGAAPDFFTGALPLDGARDVSSASATSGFDDAAVGAAFNLSRVDDFFRQRFGRNSINDRGGTLKAFVNLSAFNAFWLSSADGMVFGNFDRFASSLDVVAHEYSHGVTEFSAELEYVDQSGALNEAFSDILGEGAEAFASGSAPDFVTGTALSNQLRNLAEPSTRSIGIDGFFFPERAGEFYHRTHPNAAVREFINDDLGGVHINSSIINRAFHLLAVGLNPGIGMEKALQIFYGALTTRLLRNSQFIDCRRACVTTAEEIFGVASEEAQKAAAAFDAVEIFDGPEYGQPPAVVGTSGKDATLFTFQEFGSWYLGRREAARRDPQEGVQLNLAAIAPNRRLAIKGDGKVAAFITADFKVGVVDIATGFAAQMTHDEKVNGIAYSADGRTGAVTVLETATGLPNDGLGIFNDSGFQIFRLQAPVLDGSASAKILFARTLDISPDGRYVFFDALNRLTYQNGEEAFLSSIYSIDRETGRVATVIPPTPGLQIGNPALGQSHPHLLTFEVVDSAGVHYVKTANLFTGRVVDVIATGGGQPVLRDAAPGFTGDDRALIFTEVNFDLGAEIPFVKKLPLIDDFLTPGGEAPSTWMSGRDFGAATNYRRGKIPTIPRLSVTVSDPSGTLGTDDEAEFKITRDAASKEPMPFFFTLTGSAINGTDFEQIPLSGVIPAGKKSVPIPVIPRATNLGGGDRILRLSLHDTLFYRLTAPIASLTLLDPGAAGRIYVTGKYLGLLSNNTQVFDGFGALTLKVDARGAFSGTMNMGATKYVLRGAFLPDGTAVVTIPRAGASSLIVYLAISETGELAGSTSNGFQIGATRSPFHAKGNPSPQAGIFTMLLRPPSGLSFFPRPSGHGYATMKVGADGAVRAKGVLADGTPFSAGGALWGDAKWPIYVSLSRGLGALCGVVQMTTDDGSGPLAWFRPFDLRSPRFPFGFTVEVQAEVGRYTPPLRDQRALTALDDTAGAGTATLTGADLVGTLTAPFTLTTSNAVQIGGTNPANIKLRVAPGSGLFSGSFAPGANGKARPIKGALLQRTGEASGHFLSPFDAGNVKLE